MEILRKPVLTEKATKLTEGFNRYVFIVDKNANKIQIKGAIHQMYGVTVESVNTMRYSGKVRTRGTKKGSVSGRTASFKKAVVSVAKGEAIDFYGTV